MYRLSVASCSTPIFAENADTSGNPRLRRAEPILCQAKRYQAGNTVGSEELRNFIGAMSGKVDRGVFLTTSTFTHAAELEFEGRGTRVVLINGEELVDLMIEHGVGVEPIMVAAIRRINEDFFDEL